MPIIKSAKKRMRTANKAAVRNSKVKRSMRESYKKFQTTFSGKDASDAISKIDLAVKKGIIHKNKAARKKAQIAAQGKQNKTKIVSAKSTKPTTKSAKPATKKTTAKKAPAKKTATKKTTNK
ncbi:30S ribosomal protein S20 [Candidatus Saccharibacteria bacterium]|nr:30S ribosomal protein S20 [Candidatus Saccharibacteria bacterium]